MFLIQNIGSCNTHNTQVDSARTFLPLCAALLLGLSACTRTHTPEPEITPSTPARRIVVLGPSTTANLFAMHQGHRIIAVSDYCTTPEANDLPRVGGLADPSLERIVALNPDLVLVQGNIPRVEQLCASMHIPFHAFTTDSLEEWNEEIIWLAETLQVPDAGDALRDTMRHGLESFGKQDNEDSPSVLLVINRRREEASGIMVAGDRGFLDQILHYAGGCNVLSGSNRDYFDLNEERLIRAAPDWILEFNTDATPDRRTALDAAALEIWRRDFPGLPAVKAGRVYTLIGKDLLIPGPAMLDTARQMQAILSAR